MKQLTLAITLIFSMSLCAQNAVKKTPVFIRVYDLQGNKIGKGTIHSISGTAIRITKNGGSRNIPVSDIGSIKTKRSAGNNILAGTLIGATAMAIVGVATADPDSYIVGYSAGEGAAAGALMGGATGAVIGGIAILFKHSGFYEINGDTDKWKAFTEMVAH